MKLRSRACLCPPRRIGQSSLSLLRSRTAKHASAQQFDAILNNALHGIEIVDRAGRLVACNRRFREIYRLSLSQTRRGQPAAAILDHRLAQGSLPGMPAAEYIARAAACAHDSKAVDFIDELSGSLKFSVQNILQSLF